MNDLQLPASILLYITGTTAVVNVIVNGIRTSVPLPALAAFGLAVGLGIVFLLLFMVANNIVLTPALGASAVIAGVLVGGASAGSNAVHGAVLPTTNAKEG